MDWSAVSWILLLASIVAHVIAHRARKQDATRIESAYARELRMMRNEAKFYRDVRKLQQSRF